MKLAEAWLVNSCGLSLIVTSGCTVSIVQLYALALPWLWSASSAFTWKVCWPVTPDGTHALKALSSILQAKVVASPDASWKTKVAVVDAVGSVGASSMCGGGGPVVSTVH